MGFSIGAARQLDKQPSISDTDLKQEWTTSTQVTGRISTLTGNVHQTICLELFPGQTSTSFSYSTLRIMLSE